MTLKEMYEAVLIEIDKDSAPNLLLEDFNYYARKASYQYVNKRYNVYDTSLLTGDDLHVLKSNAVINIDDENNLVKERYNMWSTTQLPAIYEFNLPTDYFHLLNCECFYQITKPYKCYRQGNYVHFPATRLTADISAQISTNAWLKPDWKRPYYYIHNINTQDEFPYNPYNSVTKEGNDVPNVVPEIGKSNSIVEQINQKRTQKEELELQKLLLLVQIDSLNSLKSLKLNELNQKTSEINAKKAERNNIEQGYFNQIIGWFDLSYINSGLGYTSYDANKFSFPNNRVKTLYENSILKENSSNGSLKEGLYIVTNGFLTDLYDNVITTSPAYFVKIGINGKSDEIVTLFETPYTTVPITSTDSITSTSNSCSIPSGSSIIQYRLDPYNDVTLNNASLVYKNSPYRNSYLINLDLQISELGVEMSTLISEIKAISISDIETQKSEIETQISEIGAEITSLINSLVDVFSTDANNKLIADTDSVDIFKVALFNGDYSNVERSPQVRYGNPTNVRCEIRYGTDNSVFKLKQVQIDYVKVPLYLELTQEQLDKTEDTSQVLEFPDYICLEIVNELIHLIMEKDRNDRIQTHPVVSLSIATQQLAPVQQQNNN